MEHSNGLGLLFAVLLRSHLHAGSAPVCVRLFEASGTDNGSKKLVDALLT